MRLYSTTRGVVFNEKSLRKMVGLCVCIVLIISNLMGTVGLAASTDIYELTFG